MTNKLEISRTSPLSEVNQITAITDTYLRFIQLAVPTRIPSENLRQKLVQELVSIGGITFKLPTADSLDLTVYLYGVNQVTQQYTPYDFMDRRNTDIWFVNNSGKAEYVRINYPVTPFKPLLLLKDGIFSGWADIGVIDIALAADGREISNSGSSVSKIFYAGQRDNDSGEITPSITAVSIFYVSKGTNRQSYWRHKAEHRLSYYPFETVIIVD